MTHDTSRFGAIIAQHLVASAEMLRRRRPSRRSGARRSSPSRTETACSRLAVSVAIGTDLDTRLRSSAPERGASISANGDKVMMRRRDFLMNAAATCLAPGLAGAQGAWPQRPISLVVPFGAGGSADLVARMFAQHFQAKYGISVVIENKGGAGGVSVPRSSRKLRLTAIRWSSVR